MSATSIALLMLGSGRVPRKNGNVPRLWPATKYSTCEFGAFRLVSRNVGRCLPPLCRYDAVTVMSFVSARSTVSSDMLISGRSSVGDRYWIEGRAVDALGGALKTAGY